MGTLSWQIADNRAPSVLMAVLDTMDDGVLVVDAALQILYCNAQFSSLFPLSSCELAGKSWLSLMQGILPKAEDDDRGDSMALLLDRVRRSGEGVPVSASDTFLYHPVRGMLRLRLRPLPEGGFVQLLTVVDPAAAGGVLTEEAASPCPGDGSCGKDEAGGEDRYALAVRSANDGVYDWDILANTILFSERLRDLFALPSAFLTPEEWCSYLLPEDLASYREHHLAHLKGQTERFSCEYRVRTPDGGYRWVRQHGLALRDEKGRAVRLTGSVADITDYKHATLALQESERRYALAMESINEGVYEWDVASGVIHVTPRLRELFLLKKDHLLSEEWVCRVHPDDLAGFLAGQRALLKGVIPRLDMEYRLSSSEPFASVAASWRWVKQRGIAVRNEQGWTVRVIGSSGDVTDRRAAEQTIRDLIEAVPLPIVVTSLEDQHVMFVNERAQRAYRIHPEMGSVKSAYVVPQERDTLLQRLLDEGQVDDYEVQLYTPEDEEAWALMSARTMTYQGEPAVLVASAVITEQKKLEADLQAAKERAEMAFASLQQAQQNLIEAEKMASLGGLVAGVAHEINTPVGITLTTASHLQDKITALRKLFESGKIKKQDFADFLAVADGACTLLMSNSTRAANLIQSFKQVAVDQTSDERRVFDLAEYIDEVLLSLGPRLRRTSHRVLVDCPPHVLVDGYPGPLSQVLTNFVMNSLLHGFDGGRENGLITISVVPPALDVEPEAKMVEIIYTDDGKGIPFDHLKKIFDPFFTTKRGDGGSGLGLNIVYNIVSQSLKGTIRVVSEVGHGASFILRFPAVVPHVKMGEKKA